MMEFEFRLFWYKCRYTAYVPTCFIVNISVSVVMKAIEYICIGKHFSERAKYCQDRTRNCMFYPLLYIFMEN